jgi:hypothetical protein
MTRSAQLPDPDHHHTLTSICPNMPRSKHPDPAEQAIARVGTQFSRLHIYQHHTTLNLKDSEETTRTLKLKLSFLAHDLRTFQSNPNAEARLSTSIVSHNIGPLLTESEAVRALATPLHTFRPMAHNPMRKCDENDSKSLGTFLDERLAEIVLNRAKNNKECGKTPDFVLCASHDLAPLLQVALGLKRGFDDAKEFKSAYKQWDRVQCNDKSMNIIDQ